jgi:NAD(P)-dependent dehydrogenase (short-subunit alcohol dehydrogenase family)
MKREKIVIIGGTSGMGLATARAVLGEGYEAVIAGRDRKRLDGALKSLPGASGAPVDASDRRSLDAFFGSVGTFDHLVLSLSGNKGFGLFRDLSVDDIERGFREKAVVQIRSAQAALNHIRTDGSITFITAASAQSSQPGISGYAAINGAIERMVPPLARELAPIRINAVSPGVVDTPWWDFMGDTKKAVFAETREHLPVGRIGASEEIASVVMMLIKNGFVTGSVIIADGGGHLL